MPDEEAKRTVQVKICGITSAAALDAAIEAGADFFGLVHFRKSPRHVDTNAAARLREQARGRMAAVCLLVDPDDELLRRIAGEVAPDMIQLHGGETPERVREISMSLSLPVIKAVRVGSADHVAGASAFAGLARFVLFDARPENARLPGGTGATFDWSLVAEWRSRPDFMLSGGLNPDNVARAIGTTGPAAVDVSSGVESAPGVKSPEMIRRFVQAARAATACATPSEAPGSARSAGCGSIRFD